MNLREVKEKIRSVKPNMVDRVVNYFSPVAGSNRLRARAAQEILGGYDGASTSRRSLSAWKTLGSDADTDILDDLPKLRERSRDLVRNNPLAAGAIKTKVSNVVGTGLRLQSHLDREAIGLDDDTADAIERQIEREFRLWWESKDCDITRTQTGHGITRMVYQQSKENGDVFVLLPMKPVPTLPYSRRLQVVEADRICNRDDAMDTDRLAGGVEKDDSGAPVAYHIMDQHPGDMTTVKRTWTVIPAYGRKTGLRNVIHLYNPTRPGQSRGVPDLAAVIEPLKQLGRYTDAEVMAAVVSGMFTVFIESENGAGTFDYSNLGTEVSRSSSDKDMKLGNGMIVELAAGEKIHDTNPGRPNQAFDPFVQAILRQVGVALEIPFEILIKHFTASYSAARAALLEMWKYVLSERRWLVDNFLRPVFEVWFYEAVALGRIPAPGFLSDPAIRAAYLSSDWVGPARGQIDELKEVKAARERLAAGLTTLSQETAELTGGDWERNHPQQVKENNKRLEDGLVTPPIEPGDVEDTDGN
jgi:lambda family phage portal protein